MNAGIHLLIHLVAIVCKINYMTIVHYGIIADCAGKDLLQQHAANNPCDWKPSLGCRGEGVKLDVPENKHWLGQMDASGK
jgi:hypothetical protein